MLPHAANTIPRGLYGDDRYFQDNQVLQTFEAGVFAGADIRLL